MKNIMIVEDHPVFREGLTKIIEQEEDLHVCGEAEDVISAIERLAELKTDLVIADLSLKGKKDGIELIKTIHARYKLPVLVLSMHEEAVHAQRAMLAGARGYITKQDGINNLITAIRTVLSGEIYLSDQISKKILNTVLVNTLSDEQKSPVGKLSGREWEVFQLIALGYVTNEIAEKMSLKISTVESYRARIKEKLNLKSTAELLKYAVQWGRSNEIEKETPD